jgi:hypothetical protein
MELQGGRAEAGRVQRRPGTVITLDKVLGKVEPGDSRGRVALGGDTLLLACSDHGMETTARTIQVDDLLIGVGLKAGPDSTDLVTAPNGTATLPAAPSWTSPLARS